MAAIDLPQKGGRVDNRDIDQFMDDVIFAVRQISTAIDGIDQIIEIVVNATFICPLIASDVIIPSGKVLLQRNPTIADGVNVEIQDGGEFYIL